MFQEREGRTAGQKSLVDRGRWDQPNIWGGTCLNRSGGYTSTAVGNWGVNLLGKYSWISRQY